MIPAGMMHAHKLTASAALQMDVIHVKLAKAHVHQAAALQAAKQQAEADKARQKRMKTLQRQHAKVR